MKPVALARSRARWLVSAVLLGWAAGVALAADEPEAGAKKIAAARAREGADAKDPDRSRKAADARQVNITSPVPLTSTLDPNNRPIDLNTALRLAGVQNPELLAGRASGSSRRSAPGSSRRPRSCRRSTSARTTTRTPATCSSPTATSSRSTASALYVGAGANAVAAGTVNIPGVVLSRQHRPGPLRLSSCPAGGPGAAIRQRRGPQPGLPGGRPRLLRAAPGRGAPGRRPPGPRRGRARSTGWWPPTPRSARTSSPTPTGPRPSWPDAQADVQRAEGEIQVASARLCEVLNLDPSVRLHPTDAWVVPANDRARRRCRSAS